MKVTMYRALIMAFSVAYSMMPSITEDLELEKTMALNVAYTNLPEAKTEARQILKEIADNERTLASIPDALKEDINFLEAVLSYYLQAIKDRPNDRPNNRRLLLNLVLPSFNIFKDPLLPRVKELVKAFMKDHSAEYELFLSTLKSAWPTGEQLKQDAVCGAIISGKLVLRNLPPEFRANVGFFDSLCDALNHHILKPYFAFVLFIPLILQHFDHENKEFLAKAIASLTDFLDTSAVFFLIPKAFMLDPSFEESLKQARFTEQNELADLLQAITTYRNQHEQKMQPTALRERLAVSNASSQTSNPSISDCDRATQTHPHGISRGTQTESVAITAIDVAPAMGARRRLACPRLSPCVVS